MSRTSVLLALAAGLALLALVLGREPLPSFLDLGSHPTKSSGRALSLDARLSNPILGPSTREVFASLELTGATLPDQARRAVDFALVLDRSGSMAGEKLASAKEAARSLVRQLRDSDRLTLVHYGSDVRVFPARFATSENKEALLRDIDGIVDDGGTNMSGGLVAARDALRSASGRSAVKRMLLLSDGEPTEGVTDAGELGKLARAFRAEGISLSAVGVGTEFNENLMQTLAELGSGSYGFMRDGHALASLFQKDLNQASTAVARGVSLSFELPEQVELGEVLGYAAEQNGRSVRVSLPDFSSGQVERVVVRLVPGESSEHEGTLELAKVRVSYDDLLTQSRGELATSLVATRTASDERALAGRDAKGTLDVTRARGAQNLTRAADAMAAGNLAGATGYLNANAPMYKDAEKVAGPGALADDFKSEQDFAKGVSGSAQPEEISAQIKSAKLTARRNFGRMGSTY